MTQVEELPRRGVPQSQPESVGDRGGPPSRVDPWVLVGVTTTLLGTAIALGPVLGPLPVAFAALAWMATVAFVAAALVRRARWWSVWHWVFVAGVGAAVFRASALGIMHVLRGRATLVWDVDLRYHVMLAKGIARFAGVRDTLDYSGTRLEYHASISWIAGALNRTFGISVNFGLFVLVPIASVIVLAIGAYRVLRLLGAPTAASLVSVALVLNLPSDPVRLVDAVVHGDEPRLLDANAWVLSTTMLTLYVFALAVGFTAAWLLLGADSWRGSIVGAACLATLVAIKPQYFIGLGAVIAVALVLRARRRANRVPYWLLAKIGITVLGFAGLVYLLNPEQNSSFPDLDIDIAHGIRQTLLPTDVMFVPWRAYVFGVLSILTIVAIPALRRLVRAPFVSRPGRVDLVAQALGIAVVSLVVLFVLASATPLVDGAQLATMRAVGWVKARDWLDPNFDQAMIPVALLVEMVASVLITVLILRLQRPLRVVLAVVALLLAAGTMASPIAAVIQPTGSAAPEWAEEAELADLMSRVDAHRGIWLSSDLADSGQDFARPLRMLSVQTVSDAQFYVGNVEYIGWTRPDAAARVERLQRFFGTQWSGWHDDFLRRKGVRYVIVRDRCPPVWSQTEFPGRVVGQAGDWTLMEVADSRSTEPARRAWPAAQRRPRYGASACLSG